MRANYTDNIFEVKETVSALEMFEFNSLNQIIKKKRIGSRSPSEGVSPHDLIKVYATEPSSDVFVSLKKKSSNDISTKSEAFIKDIHYTEQSEYLGETAAFCYKVYSIGDVYKKPMQRKSIHKERTRRLDFLSEFCLYNALPTKQKKRFTKQLNTKLNLTRKLKINQNGFYLFNDFDFSIIASDLPIVDLFQYWNVIYFIPEAEIERICLVHLKNCFYLWVDWSMGKKALEMFCKKCWCHSRYRI
ncbi:hypothetical protein CDIK_0214 [Cucumispora dikerogammari]|nr:hypothetical protein CDIK_0214 [Cucumispora dikerogammari]